MTRQQEIREGIVNIEVGNVFDMDGVRIGGLCAVGLDGADRVLSYLHAQGVVIKVDRESPVEENNIGNMDAIEARDFFWAVSDELGLGGNFGFGITTAGSICMGDKILIDENDLGYPWHTKHMVLHEIAHHLAPEDNTHGSKFHRKYAELVNRFLAGYVAVESLLEETP